MLSDCLKVQQVNEDSEPLFDELELKRALFCLETEAIGDEFEPLPGLKVRFINAGHIVGAACIYLQYGDRSLLYTGDYNTASTRTTIGLQLSDLPYADIPCGCAADDRAIAMNKGHLQSDGRILPGLIVELVQT